MLCECEKEDWAPNRAYLDCGSFRFIREVTVGLNLSVSVISPVSDVPCVL